MSVRAAVISALAHNGPEIKPVAGMFAHAIALRKLTILQAEVCGDGLCLRAHTPRTRTHAHPYDSAACVTPELLRMSVTRLAASQAILPDLVLDVQAALNADSACDGTICPACTVIRIRNGWRRFMLARVV